MEELEEGTPIVVGDSGSLSVARRSRRGLSWRNSSMYTKPGEISEPLELSVLGAPIMGEGRCRSTAPEGSVAKVIHLLFRLRVVVGKTTRKKSVSGRTVWSGRVLVTDCHHETCESRSTVAIISRYHIITNTTRQLEIHTEIPDELVSPTWSPVAHLEPEALAHRSQTSRRWEVCQNGFLIGQR